MMGRTLPAIVTLLPALALALTGLVSTLEPLWGGSGGVWPPDDVTLAEAAATRNLGEAERLIGLGHDPNRRERVRAGMLADAIDLQLTPLEAAVWERRTDVVRVLIDNGAQAQGESLAVLRCLANVHDDEQIHAMLTALSPSPWPDCRNVPLPVEQPQ